VIDDTIVFFSFIGLKYIEFFYSTDDKNEQEYEDCSGVEKDGGIGGTPNRVVHKVSNLSWYVCCVGCLVVEFDCRRCHCVCHFFSKKTKKDAFV